MPLYPPEYHQLIYLNELGYIRSCPINYDEDIDGNWIIDFAPKENYIIIGMIWGGVPVLPHPPYNQYWWWWSVELTPIEKHLFANTNAQFKIPTDQFRTANVTVTWRMKQ